MKRINEIYVFTLHIRPLFKHHMIMHFFILFVLSLLITVIATGCASLATSPNSSTGDDDDNYADDDDDTLSEEEDEAYSYEEAPYENEESLREYYLYAEKKGVWPPRIPSARGTFRLCEWLLENDKSTIGDVAYIIGNVVGEKGYEMGWYPIPGGFILVTNFEQISDNGTPTSERFSTKLPMREFEFSLTSLIDFFTSVREGRYRMFSFIITDAIFIASDNNASYEILQDITEDGLNKLPKIVSRMKITDETQCEVFIYEVTKRAGGEFSTVLRSRHSTRDHLLKAGILTAVEPEYVQ